MDEQRRRKNTVMSVMAAAGAFIALALLFATSGGHPQTGPILIVFVIGAAIQGLVRYANFRDFRNRRNGGF